MKKRIICGIIIVFLLLISCKFSWANSSTSTSTTVSPDLETIVELDNGLKITIPNGAVSSKGVLTVSYVDKSDVPEIEDNFFQTIGNIYAIELPDEKLKKNATIEFPIELNAIPEYSNIENLFASYYDNNLDSWVYVESVVDTQRNKVIIESNHASLWQISTWNWKAWTAILNKLLSVSIIDTYEAIQLLTNTCQQNGSVISIDTTNANDVLLGCIEKDNLNQPQVKVLNPRSFYIQIQSKTDSPYIPPTVLSPGDSKTIDLDPNDDFPIVIYSTMLGEPVKYFLVDMILRMLPGMNQLGFQGETLACITERLKDASYFLNAANTLYFSAMENGSETAGLSAAESVSKYLSNENAVERFITAAYDCNVGIAKTWSVAGVSEIASATSVIISVTDWITNYIKYGENSSISFDLLEFEITYGSITICDWDIIYNEAIWRIEETEWGMTDFDHLQLVNIENPICQVNCPYGVGLPFSWTIETGNKQFGDQEIYYKIFRNPSGGIEFVSFINSNDQQISMGFNEESSPEKDLTPCMDDFELLLEESLSK